MIAETTSSGKKVGVNGEGVNSPAKQTVQVDIRLRGIEGSERPALSNFTMVQVAPGMVVVDFGYLEPLAFESIAKAGRSGVKMSEAVSGQLASRVAIDLQTARQLAQQLNEMLNRVQRPSAIAGPNSAAAVSVTQ